MPTVRHYDAVGGVGIATGAHLNALGRHHPDLWLCQSLAAATSIGRFSPDETKTPPAHPVRDRQAARVFGVGRNALGISAGRVGQGRDEVLTGRIADSVSPDPTTPRLLKRARSERSVVAEVTSRNVHQRRLPARGEVHSGAPGKSGQRAAAIATPQ